jgi:hypothetical protein
MQDSSHLTIILCSSVIKIVISQKQKVNRKIFFFNSCLFSILVLTPFLLFFQYHKMLEKNKEWN